MPHDLTVHDTTVTETSQIPPSGVGVRRLTIVRYFVGDHGPFQLEYPTGSFTPEQAKADIQKRVQELRTLQESY